MWKVVVTEIQDASVLEPTAAPPGAFFVSTERFSRTVEALDLLELIDTITRMQSAEVCRREDRPVFEKRISRRSGTRTASLRETYGPTKESARSRSIAAPMLLQTDL